MSNLVQGRVKVVDNPNAAPGKCAMCGTIKGPVIDTNFNILGYGAVYFCFACISEIGEAIGLVSGLEQDEEEAFIQHYCSTRNLKLIPREVYVRILSAIDNMRLISDSFSSVLISINEPSKEIPRDFKQLNLLESVESTRDDFSIEKPAIQDNSNAGNKGSSSLPSSSGDGSFTFD